MPTLFTNAIETLTAADVEGLLGWPESLTVEFKEALSTKDGRSDPWLAGGKVSEFARDKLLKEVVALANTSGGHVVLGIEEEEGTTPTARAIKPLPRCADLARRLSQMAQHIDPPVPLLLIQGVATEGEAGVVVFRVPASRSAPHRAPDKECYVRRGTDSMPVSMREIQDMSIAIGRRGEWMTERQQQLRAQFQNWMASQFNYAPTAVGIHVSAIPAGAPLQLDRLYGQTERFSSQSRFHADCGSGPFEINMVRNPQHSRAVLRGVRYVYSDNNNPTFLELSVDGCVSICMKYPIHAGLESRVYMAWLLACILNVLRGVQFLRTKAQTPEAEYLVEVGIDSRPKTTIMLHSWREVSDDAIGAIEAGLRIPAVSLGSFTEVNQVAGHLLTDLRDAAGCSTTEPLSFKSISGM